MKRIYLVRHGESESNAGGPRSGPMTPLTPKGYEQAKFVAERVSNLPIEIVLSSTMLRAQETTRIIVEKIKKDVVTSDLLVERRMPSSLKGKLRDDPEALRVSQLLWDNFQVPGFRHSDEENFDDMKKRALEAFAFILDRPEEHILVVTHWFFTWAAVATAVFGEELTAREFQALSKTFDPLHNTGLSIFTYDETREHPWHIEVWNDHAHLAD